MNTISNMLNNLENDLFIFDVAKTVTECYAKHGNPEPPEGPTTDTGAPFTLANDDTMGDWGGKEVDAAEMYNNAITDLYEVVDVCYAGGGNFVTRWDAGSREWQAYSEEASLIINAWVAFDAFDDFCTNPYSIG